MRLNYQSKGHESAGRASPQLGLFSQIAEIFRLWVLSQVSGLRDTNVRVLHRRMLLLVSYLFIGAYSERDGVKAAAVKARPHDGEARTWPPV
jgi:hypothetical protein